MITANNLKNHLIDTHTHCGGMDLSNYYKNRYPSSQDILDLNKKRILAGVDYQIVFSMPTSIYYDIPEYWCNGLFRTSGYAEYPFQLENLYLLSQIAWFNLHNLLPFLSFSLRDKITQQEQSIMQMSEQHQIFGLKYHSKVDQMSPLSLVNESSFIDIALQLNIPIVFHTENKHFSYAMDVLELAATYPNTRFCAAHFGGFSKQFLNELELYPYNNIYVDTSPLLPRCEKLKSNCPTELIRLDYSNPLSVLRYFFDRYPSRMLWGTDEPWTYYGSLEKAGQCPDLLEFGYLKEARIIQSSGLQQQATDNTIKYLFG